MILYFVIGILILAGILTLLNMLSNAKSERLVRIANFVFRRQPKETTSSRDEKGAHMSRKQALRILGLSRNASRDEIKAAHRKLMQQHHPDQGGHEEMASLINRAKDRLLED